MSGLRVLVVGASIAGPTTAYWLAKAGAKVTVIERFSELRPGGQNVDIRTIGVSTMRKMAGMERAVRLKRAPLDGLSFVRANGRPYGVITATGNPDEQSLLSEYEIYRGDLSEILYNLTKDHENIEYVFGEQVAALKHNPNDITVEFANGLPKSDYDLVVACDGATSRTRPMGMGGGIRDHLHRVNAWAAYFSIKQDLARGSRIGQAFSSAPGRSITLHADLDGVNRATLMRIYPRDDPTATLPFQEASKKGDASLKQYLAKEFENIGWKSNEIIKNMMTSQDLYASEMVQVKPPRLYSNRFVMVGDAGYAPGPTGGGTSLAMGGAYILAGEIAKHTPNIEAGLAAYEKRMKPLIDDFQKLPPLVPGLMAPQTEWGLALRNYIFAFIAWTHILQYIQKFFANAFASTDKFPLPEYQWAE